MEWRLGTGDMGWGLLHGPQRQAEDWGFIPRTMGTQGRCVSRGGALCQEIHLE